MDSPLLALIVFGILFAITMLGLFTTNAAAERNNASTDQNIRRPVQPGETQRPERQSAGEAFRPA